MSRKAMTQFMRRKGETLTYIFFWLVVFLIPILMMYVRTRNHTDEIFEWGEIFHVWALSATFLVLFVVHNYLLAPLLIYKHRRTMYFSIVGVIIVAFGIFQFTVKPSPPHKRHGKRPTKEIRMGDRQVPPDGKTFDMRDGSTPPPEPHRHPFMVDQFDFISVIVLILMLGMNLGIKLLFKQEDDEKKLQELQNKNLNQQLEYLKYQINPHFFMNTLNNIHALVDIDPEEAKQSIIELSKLMRYVLYEGNRPMTSLVKESGFIDNYIELMRLRYSDKVDIRVERDETLPDALIAPLITITYVENAFKHGVSYQHKSFIHITAHVVDGRLHFTCTNSKHKESTDEHGGVGLENTRKRLDLIYGDNYKLDIDDGEDTYSVSLDVPLNQDIENKG